MSKNYIVHGSQYGNFVTVNGRKNNSSEYNHNYYLKNKDKWNKKGTLQGNKNYNFIEDWLGFDERDDYDQATKDYLDAYHKRAQATDNYILKRDEASERELENKKIEYENAKRLYYVMYDRYENTPLSKISRLANIGKQILKAIIS